MKFVSTRSPQIKVSIDLALSMGLAPDGGLFVPEEYPWFKLSDFGDDASLPEIAERLLAPFFAESALQDGLRAICEQALTFDAPVVATTKDNLKLLELYHGPTAAFKDFGARFLASCLNALGNESKILVATSGDTGGAVAAAFANHPRLSVCILYPKGMVSKRQEHQLCCWPDNVMSLRVDGDFDDCQRMVKEAFGHREFARKHRLSSANSISIGRLLPQMAYYAAASLHAWKHFRDRANFIIPTGNLGNALACIWARKCGMPIGDIVLATNANRAIPVYVESGRWAPRPTVPTLANAMDVGNPSNMERLRHLFPTADDLEDVRAFAADDVAIKKEICWADLELERAICPHTATAAHAYHQVAREESELVWIVAATAHPAKFDDTVEPLLGRTVEVPPILAELLERDAWQTDIKPQFESLKNSLEGFDF